MPIIPLACIKAAAQSFKEWSRHRPAWPNAASDHAQSSAAFFCSSTRALQSLLSFDTEDSPVAAHALCLYTTVVNEEGAAFTERLELLQNPAASLSSFPPPHVDAWRQDPLHAALTFIAHALSLLCASPKYFSALRLPHPICFCPSSSSVTSPTARGTKGFCGLKDLRWEQGLWLLMLEVARALESTELHRLHRKLCSDRALILSRCILRAMQVLHLTASGFGDVCFRMASVRKLISCSVQISWGEHFNVASAFCDVACEALSLAASLFPSMPYTSVVDLLRVVAALAAAEPDQDELQRAVEGKLNATSRLLHVASDSIFYRMSSHRSYDVTCDPQLAVHQRDVQKHLMSLSASLARDPLHSSSACAVPSCSHNGHALRVSALSCLRLILLRHSATSAENAASLRSVYRCCSCCCFL